MIIHVSKKTFLAQLLLPTILKCIVVPPLKPSFLFLTCSFPILALWDCSVIMRKWILWQKLEEQKHWIAAIIAVASKLFRQAQVCSKQNFDAKVLRTYVSTPSLDSFFVKEAPVNWRRNLDSVARGFLSVVTVGSSTVCTQSAMKPTKNNFYNWVAKTSITHRKYDLYFV